MASRQIEWRGHDGEGNVRTGNLFIQVVEPSDAYFGWNPESWSAPTTELPDLPFHNNTGLFESTRRSSLQAVNSLTTSKSNEHFRGLWVTGETNINHPGAVFEFCFFEDQININVADAPLFIYCDAGYKNGGSSTSSVNMTDGPARFYRSNFFNWVDGVSIKKSSNSTDPLNVIQDCFGHDSRICPTDGANSPSHNDLLWQSNQNNAKLDIVHTTAFLSGTNNTSGNSEICSRNSGPHWSGSSPLNTVFDSNTNGVTNGRINCAVMIKAGSNAQVTSSRSLYRGYAYFCINATTGNKVRAINNTLAENEIESGRKALNGTYLEKTGNVDLNGNPVN